MAVVTLKVRLPIDPNSDPSIPPNEEESYPPYKLILTNTNTHISTDPVDADYIPIATNTSFDRYLRVQASGLEVGEVLDNIKIWYEIVIPDNLPDELVDVVRTHSRIVTNCTPDISDYYGSKTYQDASYSKNFTLPQQRPATANVGIDGSLLGTLTRTSQPSSGITHGGFSDWILIQSIKTTELSSFIASMPTQIQYVFPFNFHVAWDEHPPTP